MGSLHLGNKKTVKRLLDNLANATPETLDKCLSDAYHPVQNGGDRTP
jgi:hypothetical protein